MAAVWEGSLWSESLRVHVLACQIYRLDFLDSMTMTHMHTTVKASCKAVATFTSNLAGETVVYTVVYVVTQDEVVSVSISTFISKVLSTVLLPLESRIFRFCRRPPLAPAQDAFLGLVP